MEDQQQSTNWLSHFETTSELFAWRGQRPENIQIRRARMNDMLIFDILLSSGGIKEPWTCYPPQDVRSLKRLLTAIESSHYDALKKDCLVYYLLKWHQDGREVAFAEARSVPPQFTALADAYWHLDTGLDVSVRSAFLTNH